MPRIVTVGAAQLGPIARTESRAAVVERLLALMHTAKGHGCDIVVYPELALTTFFPRWHFERQEDIDEWFERLKELGYLILGDASLEPARNPDGPTTHITEYALDVGDYAAASTLVPRLRRDDEL